MTSGSNKLQIETISIVLKLLINGKEVNDNTHAGRVAVIWVLLYISNGSVNWYDPFDFFLFSQDLKVFINLKPVVLLLLMSPPEVGKEKS